MQRLTATIERVVNRLEYTLKVINNDKLDCHKVTIDTLKEKKFELHIYQP
jgi:hypothetical protein